MIDSELLSYVWAHREADVRQLALEAKGGNSLSFSLTSALNAIQARQKLRLKHPAWYEVPEVFVPEAVMVEQSSSHETAEYKSRLVTPNALVLDLSGGMGADSFAFAQVAREVVYLEASEERAEVARHNFRALGAGNIICHNGIAEEAGVQLAEELQPDLIFIDPDRRPESRRGRQFLLEDCTPDVTTLLPRLREVSPQSYFLIKVSPMADLTYLKRHLPYLFDTYILSLKREVKELLLHITPESDYLVTAVEILPSGEISFTTDGGDPRPTTVSDEVGKYLYDLYPVFAKVGYQLLPLDYEVWQPAEHTHLYFSDSFYPQFPGRSFKVLECNPGEKRWLKEVVKEPLHLVAKNLPTSTDELRRRLKIREGGELFLFAYALANGQRNFVLARRESPDF